MIGAAPRFGRFEQVSAKVAILLSAFAIQMVGASAPAETPEQSIARSCVGFGEGIPEKWRLGRVVGPGAILGLLTLPAHCPGGDKRCAYSIPPLYRAGQSIAVSKEAEGFACVVSPAKDFSAASGWLPTSRIKIDARPKSVAPRWWVGTWSESRNSPRMTVSLQHGVIHAWEDFYGAGGREGGFDSDGRPAGGGLYFFEDGDTPCRVKLLPFNNMIFLDSDGCNLGGGFYRRRVR
ncbi:MAG TPA: hypothetical protein VJP88_02760 [Caulobacteraceae bacterium]|nr:hypothetical protein [Caulobacteraceae bacterium]